MPHERVRQLLGNITILRVFDEVSAQTSIQMHDKNVMPAALPESGEARPKSAMTMQTLTNHIGSTEGLLSARDVIIQSV